jgi:Zn-finger nucleic acid-binding protein
MSERHGIEIDYCPKCRGVWLDRGELDKIIERAGDGHGAHHAPPARPAHVTVHHAPYPPKKKESFLSDVFDF